MRNLRNDKKWCVRVMMVRGRGAASVMQEYGSERSAVPGGACVTCMTLDCFWSGLDIGVACLGKKVWEG